MGGSSVAKRLARVIFIIIFFPVFSQVSYSEEAGQFEKGLDAYNQGDYKTAYQLILPIASKGEPSALNLLGMMYELGLGVSKDPGRSVNYYRQAADKGYAYAQYNLAVSYDTGIGVPLNYRQAVKWYQKAALQGASIAQYNLGTMYEEGRGTAKDLKKAAHWYLKAAVQGHAAAQNNLGWLYESGQGIEQNLISAYAWFNIAAEQGIEPAKLKRDLIKRQLDEKELTRAADVISQIKLEFNRNTD